MRGLWPIMDRFVSRGFSFCQQDVQATSTYFALKRASPGYKDPQNVQVAQFLDELKEWAEAQPISGATVSFYQQNWSRDQFGKSLQSDVKLAVYVLVVVFVLIVSQVRSVFLTVVGFVHTVLSLTVAGFFYAVVLRVEWIGFLNALSLFVILGIGADGVLPLACERVPPGHASSFHRSVYHRYIRVLSRLGEKWAVTRP